MTDAQQILSDIAERRDMEFKLFARYGLLPIIFPQIIREKENTKEKI
jgi:hypothetical protein